MKKLLFVGAVAMSLLACNSGKKEKKEETPKANTEAVNAGGLKIAYYVLDSVAETFEVYKKETAIFEKESLQLQNQMTGMQKDLERVYADYEKGVRNQTLTPNQIATYEQRMQTMQQNIGEFQNSKMAAFQQKQMLATEAIQNKITKYSEEFSKENGIDLFLVTGTGSQVAYANPSMDLTVKFVSFMNKKEEEAAK